ncbi:MAG: TolC family protein [Pseudomonadota bacterium]
MRKNTLFSSLPRSLSVDKWAAALACGVFLSTTANALSVEETILFVLESNPEIQAAEANKQAIEFELDQARSFWAPRVELEGRTGASLNDGSTTPDLSASDDTIYGYEFSGRLTQLIFDGGATRSEIERNAYRIDAAALRVLERSEVLSLEAVRLYADVLRSRELVAAAQRNQSYHREVLSRIQTAFDNGVVGLGDLQQAEERVFQAEDTVFEFELTAAEIVADFIEIVGVAPQGLGAVPRLGGRVPTTLDAALGLARRNNPTIRFLQADVGAAEAFSRETNANRSPILNLEAEARYGEDVNGFEGEVRDAEIGLVLRYEFQGNRKRADRQEQARRVSESRATLLTQTRVVEREVRQTWSGLNIVRRRLSTLERQTERAREVRGTYEQEYEVGNRSLLDLLNTQAALFQAEANLINARSLRTFVEYRLLAETGTLLPTLGIEAPEDSKPYAREDRGAPGTRPAQDQYRLDARSFGDWRRGAGE